MPPKKEKCSPQQLRRLIGDHQIRFHGGPIRRKDWPDKHRSAFEPIRAISRLWYDEFEHGGDRDILTVIETKKRVRELRKRARHCRETRSNEDTWKDSVLPIVTARLNAEVVWFVDII